MATGVKRCCIIYPKSDYFLWYRYCLPGECSVSITAAKLCFTLPVLSSLCSIWN